MIHYKRCSHQARWKQSLLMKTTRSQILCSCWGRDLTMEIINHFHCVCVCVVCWSPPNMDTVAKNRQPPSHRWRCSLQYLPLPMYRLCTARSWELHVHCRTGVIGIQFRNKTKDNFISKTNVYLYNIERSVTYFYCPGPGRMITNLHNTSSTQ